MISGLEAILRLQVKRSEITMRRSKGPPLRGFHEALCDDLWGTGVSSCQVVFGRVSSPYFDNNPGTLEKLPGIAKTIRTVSPEECARVIVGAVDRPRRQVVYPFMLRFYYWNHAVLPWVTRWLMRRTGAKRSPMLEG